MTTEKSTGNFAKLEFWALTAVFTLCLPIFLDGNIGETIRYVSVFIATLFINFRIVPALANHERVTRNVLMLIATFILIGIVHFITSPVLLGDFYFFPTFQRSVIVIVVILGYVAVKYVVILINSKALLLQSFFIIVNREGLIAFGLWMIITYWLLIIPMPTEVRIAWVMVIPTGILLHGIAFHYLLPSSLKWRYPLVAYFFKAGVFCLIITPAVSIATMLLTEDEDAAFTMGALTGIVHMIFTAPLLFLIYRWQLRGIEQISELRSELGRSTANLDFLRSQINPHFLFNALNTIYGLAIQEKAERTSASVEKLGDMMRFMLLENMQEKISLKREIEYLDNYISLQKLRVAGNTDLTIEVDIPDDIDAAVRIMPMLLIPFVENAFKHGISLREQSYIKISLELKSSGLYFDVINSTHQKTGNDPEQNSNGIGLENVRQRLQHIYPGKHELLTRQTSRDFFVHLKMELE